MHTPTCSKSDSSTTAMERSSHGWDRRLHQPTAELRKIYEQVRDELVRKCGPPPQRSIEEANRKTSNDT